MSKRKTPDKSGLNGPKPKRQKLMHNINENSNNINGQIIASSRMCNIDTANTTSIKAHCYGNITLQSPIIQIKKHHLSVSNQNNEDAPLSNKEFQNLSSKINQRVKIYWEEDKQWYCGTIKDFKSSTNESLIMYDDDESEWLNLTESGHEIVEFLYEDSDEINRNKRKNNIPPLEPTNNIDIGDKVSSGKVLSTFNHGFIANINLKTKHKTNRKYTAIAFDTECIKELLNQSSNTTANPFESYQSMDILKLLHFCQFDKTMDDENEHKNNNEENNQNNGHNRDLRKKKRRNNRHNTDIAPWITIGCDADSDPITKTDDKTHIALIHSNGKLYNGYNKNKKKSKHKRKQENVYNSNVGDNNNNITKKCNTKSIKDLKAIYPLELIRQQNHNKKRKVIVIGAGISGLACARELMNYGYHVIVLEARNRSGGRILTDYTMGLDENHGCDVGGGWIHGIQRNPLTRFVERLKLTLHSTSGTIEMYDDDGEEVEASLDSKVEKEFNDLLDKISAENEERFKRIHGEKNKNKKGKKNKKTDDISLGDALNEYLNSKKDMSSAEYNLWKWHFSNLEYSNATDLTNLSLTDWDQDDEYAFNGDHCLIQEGYGRIIKGLEEGIDIRYCNIVTDIDWRADEICVMTKKNTSYSGNHIDISSCADGVPIYAMVSKCSDSVSFVKLDDVSGHINNNNDDNEYRCSACVVTLPLGVLKSGDVSFIPSLPSWKQSAIDSIGYGLLNKVIMKWSSVFWNISDDYVGYASSIGGEFYLFVNLVPVCGTPVLMSLMSGSFASLLEKERDSYIVDYAMKILRNIFGDDISDPIDFYVTKWGADRFSRGSYSYIAAASSGHHYDKLSYSIKDKLYFCGEATIRKWPASVHGAYLSGIREARKIMNNHYIHYKQKSPIDTIFKPIKDITINQEDDEEEEDELYCALCGGIINDKLCGPFLLDSLKIYIHKGCGEWSPDIDNQNNVWYNVISCIKRSKSIRCCYCGEYGASVHCHNKECLSSYHPQCASTTQYWDFNRPDEAQLFFCIKHRDNMLALHIKEPQKNNKQKNQLRMPRPPKTR